jgi:hypothetical protein
MQDVDNRGGCGKEEGTYGNSLYFLIFSINQKLNDYFLNSNFSGINKDINVKVRSSYCSNLISLKIFSSIN